MALATVLKNLCSFLEILDSARSADVVDWDQQSLHNAFQWAAYCERIYDQSKGKHYCKDLDCEIRKIGRLRGSQMEICLDVLQHSSRLLIEVLLQNSFMTPELLTLLLSSNIVRNVPDIISTCAEYVRLKASNELVSTIACRLNCGPRTTTTEVLTSSVKASSVNRPARVSFIGVRRSGLKEQDTVNCLADLLLRYLSTHPNDTSSSELTQLRSIVMNKFAESEIGQVAIATAFVMLASRGCNAQNSSVKTILVDFINSLIENNKEFTRKIPPRLLLDACSHSLEVYGHYVTHLIKCCENLKPVYQTDCVTHPRHLIEWRSPVSSVSCAELDYSEVVCRFSNLLFHGTSQVSVATKQLLVKLASRDDGLNVWSAIIYNVQYSQNLLDNFI